MCLYRFIWETSETLHIHRSFNIKPKFMKLRWTVVGVCMDSGNYVWAQNNIEPSIYRGFFQKCCRGIVCNSLHIVLNSLTGKAYLKGTPYLRGNSEMKHHKLHRIPLQTFQFYLNWFELLVRDVIEFLPRVLALCRTTPNFKKFGCKIEFPVSNWTS